MVTILGLLEGQAEARRPGKAALPVIDVATLAKVAEAPRPLPAKLTRRVSACRPVGGAMLVLWKPSERTHTRPQGLALGTSHDRSAVTVGFATKF